jgi:hypothetical protein
MTLIILLLSLVASVIIFAFGLAIRDYNLTTFSGIGFMIICGLLTVYLGRVYINLKEIE